MEYVPEDDGVDPPMPDSPSGDEQQQGAPNTAEQQQQQDEQ